MFKSYLRAAFRHFQKHTLSTVINIVGLSVGISAALIIFMMVQYDYSFDRYEPGRDRIFRVVTKGEQWSAQGIAVPYAQAMQNNVTGVEAVAPVFNFMAREIKVTVPRGRQAADMVFKKQQDVVFADAGYFSIFPHTWLAGNPRTALTQPYTLVLTESSARRYFPGMPISQMIGKPVVFADTIITTLTGVVADLQEASDFKFASFISLATVYGASLRAAYQTDMWNSVNSDNQLLVKLAPHVAPAAVEQQLTAIYKAHLDSDDTGKTKHLLQPLSKVHIEPEYGGPVTPATLRYLSLLAVFLLVLGAINFINLSTAVASARAREVGIRKTLGGLKSQLVAQFLVETFLLTCFTACVSVALLPLLLHAFGGFVPEGLSAMFLFKAPAVWAFLLLLVIVVSLVAGFYPAYVLTRFQPVVVLKNVVVNGSGGSRSSLLRRTLIIAQFVIAQVFLIGVLVVEKQVRYSMNKDMGFHKDAIINFFMPSGVNAPASKRSALLHAVGALPGVLHASLGNRTPAINGYMSTDVEFSEGGKQMKFQVSVRMGDSAYLSVYGIPLVAGRQAMNKTELLINESLAKAMGFQDPAAAVGHNLVYDGAPVVVAGIMHDFNQSSLRLGIMPCIVISANNRGDIMHVAMQRDPATWAATIEGIRKAWVRLYPDVDFDYTFFDEEIAKFYKEEQQLSRLLTWSAGVAMLISCLGILGLVIFITNGRVKEIGVRKVLGASVAQIIILLSADFAKLLLLAFVIALPIAWWEANQWLQRFAYRTALSWWLFALSGGIMILVALLIVGVRAGRAAAADPVKSLRTE